MKSTLKKVTDEDIIPVWDNDRVGSGMRRWHIEVPDIDCSGKAIVGRILHLHEVILKAVDRTLAKHGLKYPIYAVMATLRVEGAPFEMSPTALLQSLILTSGGLSNLLRRMEKAGYIQRLSDDRDGRGVIVRLTEFGRKIVEPAMRDHAVTERQLVSSLSQKEQFAMAQALGRMTACGL
jgi:DNA-binding MarR family transcriptional regulator